MVHIYRTVSILTRTWYVFFMYVRCIWCAREVWFDDMYTCGNISVFPVNLQCT